MSVMIEQWYWQKNTSMNKLYRVYFQISIFGNLVCDKVGISDWKEKDELFSKRCWDTCLVIWKKKQNPYQTTHAEIIPGDKNYQWNKVSSKYMSKIYR